MMAGDEVYDDETTSGPIVVEDHGAYVVTVDPEPRCPECRSPLTPKGCLNADCWNWRGPNA